MPDKPAPLSVPSATPGADSANILKERGIMRLGHQLTDGPSVWAAICNVFGIDDSDEAAFVEALKAVASKGYVDTAVEEEAAVRAQADSSLAQAHAALALIVASLKADALSLSAETTQTVDGPVAFTGETEVPDTSDFTGKDALNAETAEGRYVTSVPTTGQTRITGLVENADGRAVFGDGTNNTVLANLADLPLSSPNLKIQQFNAYFDLTTTNANVIRFPTAFKPGTIPFVLIGGSQEVSKIGNGNYAWVSAGLDAAPNSNPESGPSFDITNTGFHAWVMAYASNSSPTPSSQKLWIPIIAIGEMP